MKPAATLASLERAAAIADSFLFAAPAGKTLFSSAALCTPTTALPVVAPFLRRHQGEDRAAVISMWSQWYFARLLPTWTRINLLYSWQLPSDPREVSFTLDENGVPGEFVLASIGGETPAEVDIFTRFRPLAAGHIQPICHTLSGLAGIAASLFWNNAAIRIAHGFTLAREQGGDTTAAGPLLASKTLPDGTVNRLFAPVRQLKEDGSSHTIRRLCCLRYKLGDTEYCPSCPLLLANRRKNRRA